MKTKIQHFIQTDDQACEKVLCCDNVVDVVDVFPYLNSRIISDGSTSSVVGVAGGGVHLSDCGYNFDIYVKLRTIAVLYKNISLQFTKNAKLQKNWLNPVSPYYHLFIINIFGFLTKR